jgi:hypothetical protein
MLLLLLLLLLWVDTMMSHCPLAHPEASGESEHTQSSMREYSAALSEMDLSSFTPLVDSEAKQSHLEIAQEAPVSRLYPIQDAYDFWSLLEEQASRSSSGTGSGAPPLG